MHTKTNEQLELRGEELKPHLRFTRVLLALLAAIIPISSSSADELRATVKYVSASAIYLDAGRASGIQPGDRGWIMRGGDTLAAVETTYLSESSTACKVISSLGEVKPGDAVVMVVSAPPPAEAPPSPRELPPPSPAPGWSAQPVKPQPTSQWKVKGRAAAQIYFQDDLTASNFDYNQPSLSLQSEISHIRGFTINLRMRARRTNRSTGSSEWDNRYYEASFKGKSTRYPLTWSVGRTTPGRVSGVGYLDGLAGDYRLIPELSVGAFAGADPDLGGGSTQWDHRKGGIFASYEKGDWSTRRISAMAAVIGSYNSRTIEREFLYLSTDLVWKPELSFYQSAELEVNRGWRKNVAGGSLTLSSLMLSARWTATKNHSLSLNYNNRIPTRMWEDRATPDSLFDDALRQGIRLGLSSRLPLNFRSNLDFGVNGTHGQKTATSASGGLTHPSLFWTRISTGYRASYFDSEYSQGFQQSISFSRALRWGIDLGLVGGSSSYTFTSGGRGKSSTNYLRGSMNYGIRRFYGSVSMEFQRGGGFDANRIYADIGMRL